MSYTTGLTMNQAFYQTTKAFPQRTAQLFSKEVYPNDNDGHFTWAQLQERVEKIACGLMTLGIEPKERIGIIARNSPYWTQADIAIVNCGAVIVTVFPTLSFNEICYIVNDSESRYLFVGSIDILDRILPEFEKLPGVEKIILMDMNYKSGDPRVISIRDLIKLGEDNFKEIYPQYQKRNKAITADDWATILYTSGTTGQGKGVILTHKSFSSRMDGVYNFFIEAGHGINEEDRVLSFLPLSHIFDRGCSQWMAIWVGASIAYADSTATLLEDLVKYNPTWFSCVPRLYEKIYMTLQQQLAGSAARKKLFDWALKVGGEALQYRMTENGGYNMTHEYDLRAQLPLSLRIKYNLADKLFCKVRGLFGNRFRFAFSASAGIAPDLLKIYYAMGVPVLEGYGLTETTSACIYNPMKAAKPGTIGVTLNGAKVRLAEDGELETAGAGLFIGYLNKPEENEAAFTPDGWFRTGDLAVVDRDGYYRIVDRKKAIICLAIGKNVAPAKIENLFATSLAVEQIFLIGDERNYITALIVPNFTYFMEQFDKQGINYDKSKLVYADVAGANLCVEVGDDFVNQPLLKQMVEEAVQQANKELEGFESVKKYSILTKRFTEDNGQLTPTQKTKKRVILKDYAELIDSLY
ncbi:MAG: AMP-dependent synthetase/ligase [Syntrophomonadaceae bacterium]|jgi:long-chain acyl-CoA synthetase